MRSMLVAMLRSFTVAYSTDSPISAPSLLGVVE